MDYIVVLSLPNLNGSISIGPDIDDTIKIHGIKHIENSVNQDNYVKECALFLAEKVEEYARQLNADTFPAALMPFYIVGDEAVDIQKLPKQCFYAMPVMKTKRYNIVKRYQKPGKIYGYTDARKIMRTVYLLSFTDLNAITILSGSSVIPLVPMPPIVEIAKSPKKANTTITYSDVVDELKLKLKKRRNAIENKDVEVDKVATVECEVEKKDNITKDVEDEINQIIASLYPTEAIADAKIPNYAAHEYEYTKGNDEHNEVKVYNETKKNDDKEERPFSFSFSPSFYEPLLSDEQRRIASLWDCPLSSYDDVLDFNNTESNSISNNNGSAFDPFTSDMCIDEWNREWKSMTDLWKTPQPKVEREQVQQEEEQEKKEDQELLFNFFQTPQFNSNNNSSPSSAFVFAPIKKRKSPIKQKPKWSIYEF